MFFNISSNDLNRTWPMQLQWRKLLHKINPIWLNTIIICFFFSLENIPNKFMFSSSKWWTFSRKISCKHNRLLLSRKRKRKDEPRIQVEMIDFWNLFKSVLLLEIFIIILQGLLKSSIWDCECIVFRLREIYYNLPEINVWFLCIIWFFSW